MTKQRQRTSSDESVNPKKRKLQYEEDDSEYSEEFEEEQDEAPTKIAKLDFLPFIENLKTYGHEKLKNLRGKYNIAKIAATIPELKKYKDLYDQSSFNSDFNALYMIAARRKNVTMETTILVMNRYLNDGHTVEQFNGFPKAPKLPINLYISKNRSSGPSSLDEASKLRKEFASGTVDTKEYIKQYNEECKKYVKQLYQYMDDNSMNILESHIKHIKHLIVRYEKVYSDPPQTPVKRKKVVKTAFDWFKDAHKDYLADNMDSDKRERKLQRKFEKLGVEERRIYDNIAKLNS